MVPDYRVAENRGTTLDKLKLALTYQEFADAIGVSKSTAQKLVHDGKVKHFRPGPLIVRIPVTEIQAWIEREIAAAADSAA